MNSKVDPGGIWNKIVNIISTLGTRPWKIFLKMGLVNYIDPSVSTGTYFN